MTTRTDRLPLALTGSGFPWRRLAFAFLLTLAAIVLFAVAFAFGYARLHDGRVVPGAEVGGISLAGLTRAEAEAKLREELPPLSSGHITVRFADVQESISYAEIGRDYDLQLMLDQAFAVGRNGDLLGTVTEQLRVLLRGAEVEPSMTWNAEALGERVAAVAAAAEIAPVDATLVRDGSRYGVTPSVEGRTVDAERGMELANAAVNSLSSADTTVAIEAVPVPPQITTAQVQAAIDRVERVAAAPLNVSGGGETTTVSAEALRGWVWLAEQGPGQWSLVIEHEPIAQLVAQHALVVDQPAKEASFAFDGDVVVAVEGQTGYAVDAEASAANVLAALEARADGTGPTDVELPIVTVEPEFTTEEARALAPRVEKLAEWTTRFVPGPLNYDGRNIAIPTDIIDGYVVEPGATFDFLDVIGPITPERGYGYGAAIINGRTRLGEDGALGGGMCSTSTTVFNAAMRAGLQIDERRNHTYYIGRYPVGLDATVWIASATQRQTVAFTNDMANAVLVRGINRPGRVNFEIWGVPDGRTVSLSEPDIERKPPPVEKIKYVNTLPAGQRKRVEWPIEGYKSTVVRTVRDANGNVLHRDTFFSNYKTIHGLVEVGRGPGDPPHGTVVPASSVNGGTNDGSQGGGTDEGSDE